MDTNTILNSWKKSLSFFTKDSLTLIALATANTAFRSIKILLRNFWWLLFSIILVLSYFFYTLPSTISPSLFSVLVSVLSAFMVYLITITVMIYLITMTVRPSLEAKNMFYYKKYIRGLIVILLLFFVGALLGNWFILLSYPMIFFFLDSDLSLKSLWVSCIRTIRSYVYFLPLFAALGIFWLLILAFGLSIFTLLTLFGSMFFILLPQLTPPDWLAYCLPITIVVIFDVCIVLYCAALSVIYTKLKHEHFHLIFE